MRVARNVEPALLDALRHEGLDTIEGAFSYAGGEDLVKAGLGHRRRTQFTVTDATGRSHELYLKRYEREALADRGRRWWRYGVRTSPAGVEFDNIESLRTAQIPTMRAILCEEQWGLLDAERSYLIVTAVPGQKLEQCISEFLDRNADRPEMLWVLTHALAAFIRKLHDTGFVHRDLYNSHIFLNELDGRLELHLIDLARVFVPKWRCFRWRVKDLSQLKYSMPRTRWSDEYWGPFMRRYLGTDEQSVLRRWEKQIDRKAARMRRRVHRKQKETGTCE